MLKDPWLERWLNILKERACDIPILEIGCGQGADTATLVSAGFRVHAFDLDERSVASTRARVPSATIECRDIRDPLPREVEGTGTIVASLSLHYFGWPETEAIVEKIRSTLRPGGLLLCRLNSTDDINFGAAGFPAIEPNYFVVDGQPKRFFDEDSVRQLFGIGWNLLSLEHMATRKYIRKKSLWEVVLERADA